jgi:hypothetical protein
VAPFLDFVNRRTCDGSECLESLDKTAGARWRVSDAEFHQERAKAFYVVFRTNEWLHVKERLGISGAAQQVSGFAELSPRILKAGFGTELYDP